MTGLEPQTANCPGLDVFSFYFTEVPHTIRSMLQRGGGQQNQTSLIFSHYFLKGDVSHSALLLTPICYEKINEMTKLSHSQLSA